MKKALNILALVSLLALTPASLLAQETGGRVQTSDTDSSQPTQTTPGTSDSAGTAQVTSPTTGTPPASGGSESTQPGTQTPATPSTPQPPATPGSAGSGTQAADTFTSLTQLPGISEVNNELVNAESLPALFNSLYRMCIGAAAVIAVIQIMRAGVKFMTKGGSVSANTEAKDMIRNAILGLVLVLSPAIVFGIINPRILNLELSLGGLQPADLTDVDLTKNPTGTGGMHWQRENVTDRAQTAKECTEANGNLFYSCMKNDRSGERNVSATESCKTEEFLIATCRKKEGDTTPVSTGGFGFDYFVTETDPSGGLCAYRTETKKFNTNSECSSAALKLSLDNSSKVVYIRNYCSGTTNYTYNPSKDLFDRAKGYPMCRE